MRTAVRQQTSKELIELRNRGLISLDQLAAAAAIIEASRKRNRMHIIHGPIPGWHSRIRLKEMAIRFQNCATAPVYDRALRYHEDDDYTRWSVQSDVSAGWEIVSPVLQNAGGFDELRRVFSASNLVS